MRCVLPHKRHLLGGVPVWCDTAPKHPENVEQ